MIVLYKPEPDDLWFREKSMNDPATMSYNHAWGGTIPFPESKWADWYDHWLVQTEGKRFYRYLKDEETQAFVGEIAYHYDEERDIWLADVIVAAEFRGKGFGAEGLSLLCKAAAENGVDILRDDIAVDNPAAAMFLQAGFKEEYRTEEIIMLKKDLREAGNSAAKERYRRLTETPIPQLILKLSVPTIISMLVTAIYKAADTFFVGRISTEATAAVGLSFSVMAIIQAMGFFCGQGSGNYLSRMLGAGKQKNAEEMAATGLALSLILGVLVSAAIICFIVPVTDFLGATEGTAPDTIRYLRIIALGAPFTMGQFVLNNQLRYQGSASYAMVGLLTGAILNIGLDPLFIFVFDMGVGGAALATICGQIISFFVLLAGSMRGGNIRLRIRNVRMNSHYLLQILNGGSPALFRQGLASVATILLNRAARVYGDAAIAGMSVTTRVIMFVYSAMIGFGQGYQPVCSFNYGAGKTERVREGYFFCVRYGTLFLLGMGLICLGFAPGIIGFFRDDPQVVAVGAVALRCQAAALPLQGCVVMTNMMLQSMGKGIKASITASARSGLFFIPLILILPRLFGLLGVEITQSLADVLAITISIPLAASELKKMKKQ